MHFFDQAVSDQIQKISLVLELIGLSLAILDVRYPSFTKKTEERILRLQDKLIEKYKRALGKNYQIIFGYYSLILLSTLLILILFYEGSTLLIWSVCLLTLFYLTFPLIGFTGKVFSFLNRISNNRSIGALGLVLAVLGFSGEVYQVLTLYLS